MANEAGQTSVCESLSKRFGATVPHRIRSTGSRLEYQFSSIEALPSGVRLVASICQER
jgi:hypothetical protein